MRVFILRSIYMKFTFTKNLLLSSILFTGATGWNAYSTDYLDKLGYDRGFKIDLSKIKTSDKIELKNAIRLNINATAENIKQLMHKFNKLRKSQKYISESSSIYDEFNKWRKSPESGHIEYLVCQDFMNSISSFA